MYNDDDDVMKVKDIDIDDETAGVCKFFLFVYYLLFSLFAKSQNSYGLI